MKVGLVGFAGSGKSTVFQWLTGVKPDPAKALMGQSGNAKIPDPRLDWLSAKFKPKKTTLADLDFLDTQGVSRPNAATIRAASASSAWPTACSSSSTASAKPTRPASCAASARS